MQTSNDSDRSLEEHIEDSKFHSKESMMSSGSEGISSRSTRAKNGSSSRTTIACTKSHHGSKDGCAIIPVEIGQGLPLHVCLSNIHFWMLK